LLSRFRRITYSTAYLPAVDGLRFLAIFSVVVIMHISHYIDEKFFGNQMVQNRYWNNFIIEGGAGVPLFFMISGFILSLPFAQWRLNGAKKIDLKRYYLRRLTRLEPPYIIALIIFFIVHVWLLQTYSFKELLPRFFASAFYLHTIIYKEFSPILPVAWSLEVEVQFYLLAPLFFTIFLIKPAFLRRVLMLAIILSGAVYWFGIWARPQLFMYLHFFFCGILATDLYVSNKTLISSPRLGALIGIGVLAGFVFIPFIYIGGYLLKFLCMFLLLHTLLTNKTIEKLFSLKLIATIGGMCYSIYLLHFAIISFAGQFLIKSGINLNQYPFIPLYYLLFIILVLVISSIYFLLIEKPFMRPIKKVA
jgi:peptidoglycan/LPS O-acetylase OafA/YrhL